MLVSIRMTLYTYYYTASEDPEKIESISADSIYDAFKILTLANKYNLIWISEDIDATDQQKIMSMYELQQQLIQEMRISLKKSWKDGTIPPPESIQEASILSFADIRNLLDKKADERTIMLYDQILQERLKSLPQTSYEDRAVTQAYILKNILKRKRFFVENRVTTDLNHLEKYLSKHCKILEIKIKNAKNTKSLAIHKMTFIAFLSISIDLLGQLESAFKERGFNSMTTRTYILKARYYTELIRAKELWSEWIFRVIWNYSSSY